MYNKEEQQNQIISLKGLIKSITHLEKEERKKKRDEKAQVLGIKKETLLPRSNGFESMISNTGVLRERDKSLGKQNLTN